MVKYQALGVDYEKRAWSVLCYLLSRVWMLGGVNDMGIRS